MVTSPYVELGTQEIDLKKKAKQTSVSSKNWKNKQKTTTKYDKTNRKKNNNKKRKMFK